MSKQNQHKPNVPELRFPEFSGEWEEREFNEVVTISKRLVDPREKIYQELPHIGPGNIEKKTGKLLEYNLVKDENLISGKFKFGPRDIIYGKINPQLVKICFPKFEGLASADAYPLTCIKNQAIPEFIFQSLFTSRFIKYSISVSMRTGMPKINRDELSKFKFILPSLKEQQKIGDFFSKLDRQIELEEKKLALLEEQKKGYMQKIFSQELRFKDKNGNDYPEWEEKKLGEVFDFQNGKAHENLVNTKSEYKLINSKFISSNGEVCKNVSERLMPLYKGDITIVMSDIPNGKALAKCFLVREDNVFTLNQRIGRLYNYFGNPNFYYMLLNRNKQLLKYDSGVGQTNLKKMEILSVNLRVPTSEEQEKIGILFESIGKRIIKQTIKIKRLKDEKKSFLQKMFL